MTRWVYRYSLWVLLLLGVLLTLSSTPSPTAPPPLTVSVIHVGQGDSILLTFPNGSHMLVDAGPTAAGSTVVQYLRSRGVKKVDILVASHPHEDHIGGMQAVLTAFPVGKVWDSGYNHGSKTQEALYQTIKRKQIRFGLPRSGFSEDIGDVHVAVVAPGRNLLTGTSSDANNNSLVLHVRYHNVSFLLTGDREEKGRAAVAAWPQATVLKVSHHGSRNGTDAAFLKAVKPKYAAISYGKGNSYGHPHRETLTALHHANVQGYHTALHGTVVFSTDGTTVNVVKTGSGVTSGGAGGSGASSGATGGSGGGTRYIGNKNTKVFHLPSCSYLPYPENRVYFNTRQAAVHAGYRPCKKCHP